MAVPHDEPISPEPEEDIAGLIEEMRALERASIDDLLAWEQAEKEVDEHIRKGEVESFDTMDEFLSSLDDQPD